MRKPATLYEEPATREHHRARWWRRSVVRLTTDELAELSGYSREAIFLFERGANSAGKLHNANAWRRYKVACAGVQAMVSAGVRSVDTWQWGMPDGGQPPQAQRETSK